MILFPATKKETHYLYNCMISLNSPEQRVERVSLHCPVLDGFVDRLGSHIDALIRPDKVPGKEGWIWLGLGLGLGSGMKKIEKR